MVTRIQPQSAAPSPLQLQNHLVEGHLFIGVFYREHLRPPLRASFLDLNPAGPVHIAAQQIQLLRHILGLGDQWLVSRVRLQSLQLFQKLLEQRRVVDEFAFGHSLDGFRQSLKVERCPGKGV